MRFRDRSARRQEPSIDLTSLLDAVFILLFFFVLTSSFSGQETSLPVELPEGSSGAALRDEIHLTAYLSADGTVALQAPDGTLHEGLARDELGVRLAALRDEHGPLQLFLRGDETVLYGEVIRIIDQSREAGFTRVYNVIRGNSSN